MTEHVAGKRFTVVLSARALERASAAGVSLPRLVAGALDHINELVPGPRAVIHVIYEPRNELITQTGTAGLANTAAGTITIGFGSTSQVSVVQAVRHLPQSFSHEVDHIVRSKTSSDYCCS